MEIDSSETAFEGDNIPEWLLVEVLIILPAKIVFRCKLVSKQWLSIISSSPCFALAYKSRASLLSQQPWTLVSIEVGSKCSQVLEYGMLEDMHLKPSLCAVPALSIDHQEPPAGMRNMILGVSSGLVLYGSSWWLGDCSNGLVICYISNPLTRQCFALPPVICVVSIFGWGFVTHVKDGFLKSYRVVRLETPLQKNSCIVLRVYNSEIGEWKRFILHGKPQIRLDFTRGAFALNGNLHWIDNGGHVIIAYDPYQDPESMNIFAFPGDIKNLETCFSSCILFEYQGKLGCFQACQERLESGIGSFKIWVLNDYKSGDWYLQNDISIMEIQYGARLSPGAFRFHPIAFHPFDSDIVYLEFKDVCVSYNIKTRRLEVEEELLRHRGKTYKQLNRSYPWWWLVVVLVFPSLPLSIPKPSLGGAIED